MSIGTTTTLVIERLVTPVAKMHHTISRRWFNAVGPPGKPIGAVHDTVAATVYSSIRIAGSIVGMGIDHATKGRPLLTAKTQAVLNGLWGDELGRHRGRLEIPMGLHDRSGKPVPIDRIDEALPDAGGHVAVLVHGFADTERCWLRKGAEPGLFETLSGASPLTPVMLRYNTGRPVAANGDALSDLLERMNAEWPVPIESIALIGHSMGGLVIERACIAAQEAGHSWLQNTTDVITLGAPHRGTPIEKVVAALAHGLGFARESRPLQEFVDTRSRGIKDLRSGIPPAPLPEGISKHFVAGVVTSNPSHPAGTVLGDLVVGVGSASGGAETDPTNVTLIGGVRHNELVRNETAIKHVLDWIHPRE